MKRCPECEFLYENESTKCEMDGTPLRFTATLPALPGFAKTVCDKWTIALVSTVFLATVLVILYRATPQAYTSSIPVKIDSSKHQSPVLDQKSQSTQPDLFAPQSAADESEPAPDDHDPVEGSSTTRKTTKPKPASSPTEAEPTPAIHIPDSSNDQTTGASSTSLDSTATKTDSSATETPASLVTATSVHPKPPDTTSSKTPAQNQKQNSGVKSIFKKARKLLKKTFGEN